VARVRQWELDKGLQELLSLALKHKIGERLAVWAEQVDAGVIDNDTRSAFVAFGWITQKDHRVKNADPKPRQPRREGEPPPPPTDE